MERTINNLSSFKNKEELKRMMKWKLDRKKGPDSKPQILQGSIDSEVEYIVEYNVELNSNFGSRNTDYLDYRNRFIQDLSQNIICNLETSPQFIGELHIEKKDLFKFIVSENELNRLEAIFSEMTVQKHAHWLFDLSCLILAQSKVEDHSLNDYSHKTKRKLLNKELEELYNLLSQLGYIYGDKKRLEYAFDMERSSDISKGILTQKSKHFGSIKPQGLKIHNRGRSIEFKQPVIVNYILESVLLRLIQTDPSHAFRPGIDILFDSIGIELTENMTKFNNRVLISLLKLLKSTIFKSAEPKYTSEMLACIACIYQAVFPSVQISWDGSNRIEKISHIRTLLDNSI